MRASLLLVSLHVLVPAFAGAQTEAPTEDDRRPRALELAVQAQDAFQNGRLEDAVQLLQQARDLYPEPRLLYNLGRVHEGLGNEAEALEAFEAYVVEAPNADDGPAVEARIEALREAAAERERIAEDRERERRAREDAERRAREAEANRGSSALPWVLTATGVAALGTAVVTGRIALDRRDEAEANSEHLATVETFEQAQRFANTSNALFVVGGVVLATGVVWLIVNATRSRPPPVDVSVSASRTASGIRLVGHF